MTLVTGELPYMYPRQLADIVHRLEPHEDSRTDIVLLGHSMGGMLAAEVVLQQPTPFPRGKPLRHRILGMIGFDTPFLGMHPGVVVSGIGSLFRPALAPPTAVYSPAASTAGLNSPLQSQVSLSPNYAASSIGSIESSQPSIIQSITSPLASPPINDPNFDAPFNNDVHIPERKGWNSLLHFVNKHSDGLIDASKSYFMSHIEFGSVMADYPGMKLRYEKVRMLEDIKDTAPGAGPIDPALARKVRFLNYYTASTGRPKVPKAKKESPPTTDVENPAEGSMSPEQNSTSTPSLTPMPSLTLSDHQSSEERRLAQERERMAQEERRMRGEVSTPIPDLALLESQNGAKTSRQLDEAPTVAQIEDEIQHLGVDSGVHASDYESDIYDANDEPFEMQHIDSVPIDDDGEPQVAPEPHVSHDEEVSQLAESIASTGSSNNLQQMKSEPALPPLPEVPIEPAPIDLDKYTDKDERKIAEKEQKRVMKVFQQAVKDRESAVKDRKKSTLR